MARAWSSIAWGTARAEPRWLERLDQMSSDQVPRQWRAARLSSMSPPKVGPSESEQAVLRLRRSLYVVADVRSGDLVTRENVRSIRPSGGLATDQIEITLGRTFRQDVSHGTPLTWDLI